MYNIRCLNINWVFSSSNCSPQTRRNL